VLACGPAQVPVQPHRHRPAGSRSRATAQANPAANDLPSTTNVGRSSSGTPGSPVCHLDRWPRCALLARGHDLVGDWAVASGQSQHLGCAQADDRGVAGLGAEDGAHVRALEEEPSSRVETDCSPAAGRRAPRLPQPPPARPGEAGARAICRRPGQPEGERKQDEQIRPTVESYRAALAADRLPD
jgi:hypothetical protein